jgi:hypothetical protein
LAHVKGRSPLFLAQVPILILRERRDPYHGVRTTVSIVVCGGVRVRVSVARVDSRTQESQRGCNGLFWFGPIDALRSAADDPYTQEHPKSGGLQQSVHEKERDLVGDHSVLILGMPRRRWSLPPRWRGGRRRVRWRSYRRPSLGCSALGAELEWNGEDANDLPRIVLPPLRIRPPPYILR